MRGRRQRLGIDTIPSRTGDPSRVRIPPSVSPHQFLKPRPDARQTRRAMPAPGATLPPRVSLSFYRAGAIQGLTAGKTLNPAWSARTKMLFHEVEKQARMLGART